MAWSLVTTWVISILCHSLILLCLLSDAVSLKREFKQMVCFTADQIEEVDLTRIAENTTVSSPASSDEEVCF
jgi:hypothetical protein